MRMKLVRLGLAVVVAAVLALMVAAAPASAATEDSGKVVLKIGWQGDVDNLNPFIGWSNNVFEVWSNAYLLLMDTTMKDLKPGPNGVAKSCTVSEDGLTWTFKLNEGLTWQDDTPLTAKDVAFTYNYIIENEMSAYIGFLDGVVRAEAVDDLTCKIICSKPKANLVTMWLPILPEHVWGELSGKEAGTSYKNSPPVVGSGPFRIVEWKKGRYLRLKANKDFFLGAPTVDEVLYVVYQNGDTMAQDLKRGAIDAAYMFPQAQWSTLKKTAGIKAIEFSWFNWDYLGINCYDGKSLGNPVLRDKRFRAALEYAVDRQSLVKIAYADHAWPGYSFIPPNTWRDPDYHWEPTASQRRDFDLDAARQALDDAGYVDADGDGIREDKTGKPIKLRLWASAEEPECQRASKLIAGWWQDIGLDIDYSVQDDGVYYDKIWNYEGDTFVPDFDIYYWQWDGYMDPGQTLDCWTTSQIEGWNEMAWSNAEYDRLDVEQNQALDPEKRAKLIRRMQEVMWEDAATIVTVFPLKLEAYRTDKWSGWTRCNYGQGPAFCNQINPWAYYKLLPRVAQEGDGGLSAGAWIGIILAVVVVAGAGVWLVLRSRRRSSEAEE